MSVEMFLDLFKHFPFRRDFNHSPRDSVLDRSVLDFVRHFL